MWVSLSIETFWASTKPALSEVRSCVCHNEGFSPVLLMGWVEDPGLGSPSCLLSQGLDAGKMGWPLLSVRPQSAVDLWIPYIYPLSHSQCFWAFPVSTDLCKALGGACPGLCTPPPTCVSNQHRNDHKTKM